MIPVEHTSRRSAPSGRTTLRHRTDRSSAEARAAFLTVAVVIYTHLWILEGAFRKWVPGTDEVMYFARDGVIILAIAYVALRYPSRMSSGRAALFWIPVLVLCAWGITAALLGDSNVQVALVGIRAYVAPTLLIYVVWINRLELVWRRILRIVLFYAPVQAGIVAVQVLSPLSSPINAGAGGVEGKFTTADGIARATGTFTFSQGLTTYATLAFGVAVACMLSRTIVARAWVVWLALASCIVMIAVSGSRGLVLTASIVFALILIHQLPSLRIGDVWRVVGMCVIALATWLAVQQFLPLVIEAFETRFSNAARSEDPILRLLDSGLGFVFEPFRLVGSGIGMNSQAGIAAGSTAGWIEDEPRRWAAELGAFGFVMALGRVALGAGLLIAAVVGHRRWDTLATGLAAVAATQLLIGAVTGTPSAQGAFAVTVAALISLRYRLSASEARPPLDRGRDRRGERRELAALRGAGGSR